MPEQMIELRAFLTVMFKAMQEKEALSIVKDPDARVSGAAPMTRALIVS